ncbi:Membrane cofactor protein [Bienertia sinuspersici]
MVGLEYPSICEYDNVTSAEVHIRISAYFCIEMPLHLRDRLQCLALLQMHNQSPKLNTNSIDAPEDKIQEATAFYPFAEAAYTVCDENSLFPQFFLVMFTNECADLILSRVHCLMLEEIPSYFHVPGYIGKEFLQHGAVTGLTLLGRPVLQGDNWWRGHAAAFLKYVNLPKTSLRRGRVNQVSATQHFVL